MKNVQSLKTCVEWPPLEIIVVVDHVVKLMEYLVVQWVSSIGTAVVTRKGVVLLIMVEVVDL